MVDFIEKLLITIAVCVFALSYTLRAVEAGSMPAEPRQTSVSIDTPDPIDSAATFEAR